MNRSKSSKEEVPAKFKASIIPTEKISEFDEILEKGEMKIDWTSACDDIDYEEELIFDLDEAAKKAKSSPPRPKVEETSTQSAKITTERHPSFEDEFKRGQSNPSSRVLYDPRDGKQKHLSSMTGRDRDGGQRPRRDSRSMSEKSDEGPVPPRGGIKADASRGHSTRDSRNAPPAGINPRDAPRGTSFPGPPQSQLAPRFQRQLQNEQMNASSDKRDQPRSGLTSLGTVRQRPVQEVKQFDAEADNRRRPDNYRNDSQVLNHSSKQQEDRWRSKGDELNWRNQAKKVDPQPNQQRSDSVKKPDHQRDNIIILKHEDKKSDADKDRSSQVDQESPGKSEARDPRLQQNRNSSFSGNTSNVRNNPPAAPPGLQNQSRVRPEESSWRNKSDADRRQDKSDGHRREQESNRNDQFQGKVDDRTNTRRDSDTNRRDGKPDERQGDNRQSDFSRQEKNDQLRGLNRGDDHHFEKQMQELSLEKNKTVGPSVFQESKTAPRLPSEPAFRSSNIIQTGLKKDVPEATGMVIKSAVTATGPVLARVLAGSNYGPPPSKAAFETLSKPLSQSSSLEHQDSGVDVGPDHPTSAASSQRSSPGGAGDKRPGGQRVVLPANTSLIGKSVEPVSFFLVLCFH